MQLHPVLARPLRLTSSTAWRYRPAAKGRDERIDFLRGIAILAVLINHVALRSLYHVVSVEAIGPISGAEGFVLLSGIVTGLVYRGRLARDGWRQAARGLLKRAWLIYRVALAVVLAVYMLGRLSLVDASILTTYMDSSTGTLYSLYGTDPAPPTLALNIALLRYGPGQINILGLYVALLAATPGLLWLLARKQAAAVVGLSWLCYVAYMLHPVRALPSQSENSFPLLAWQLLFVHGLVAGYYRERLGQLLASRTGRVLSAGACALFAAGCFFALNNPWYDVPGAARLRLLPEPTYFWIYAHFFQRTALGLGRWLDTLLVVGVLYGLLTRYWVPCRRLAGWLCVPLGQTTLYVFVVHLAFVLLVANIGALQQGNLLLNTLAHTLVIMAVWLMVRYRVLFRWIPR